MLSTFFYQDGRSENQLPRARAVMVDMEPKVGNDYLLYMLCNTFEVLLFFDSYLQKERKCVF